MAGNKTIKGARRGAAIPHGAIPFHQIGDPQLRDAVMKINENLLWLEKKLTEIERKESQR